jgi:ABC-type branched-subunit amino acid transport system substrate-binding protein
MATHPSWHSGPRSLRPRGGAAVSSLALIAVLSACGSTVQVRSSTGGPGLEPSDAADLGLGSRPVPESGGDNGLPVAVGELPGPAESGESEEAGPIAGPTFATGSGPRQRGPIEVGFYVTTASSNQALEGAGLDARLGDPRAAAQAVVADLNARGGIGGRPIKPVFAYMDATSTQGYDAQAQAACATFFTDHHVAAVIDPFRADPPLLACVKRQRMPLILPTGLAQFTAADFAANQMMVSSTVINEDRLMQPYVNGLHAQHFFTAPTGTQPVKVGILYYDLPGQKDVVEQALVPALTSKGLTLNDRFGATWVRSSSDNAALANQMQAASLRFRQNGITHVLFLDPGGSMAWLFGLAANNQRYYPRYGYTSQQLPGAFLQSSAPPQTLRGSAGVGWLPVFDVDAARDPGISQPAKRCLDVMARAGLDMSNRSARGTAFAVCEGTFLLQQALTNAGRADTAGFFTGLDQLRDKFLSVNTFRTQLSPTRRDGAAEVRNFRYVDGCQCFEYTKGSARV